MMNGTRLLLGFLGFALVGAVILLPTASGEEHYYEFVMTECNFTRLCSTKSMPVVNGSFPGPVIRVHKGDSMHVNVYNYGRYGVTIHWHGVEMLRNPWSDGPEYVTQCPIEPGSNFTYTVLFREEEGTLWWHAHSDWTRATVHGAIIILPRPGSTYPFPKPDVEEVIVLGSWYKPDVMELMEVSLAIGNKVNASDAYVINGQPGDFYPCSKDSTYRLTVDYGKTYLLRIVNAGLNRDFFFGIANHNLTAVGMDATYIKPLSNRFIVISPGHSMDVLLTADQPPSHYYILLVPFFDAKGSTDFDDSVASAILQYSGNYTPPAEPIRPRDFPTYGSEDAGMNFVFRLRSLASKEHPVDVPMEVTTKMYMVIDINIQPCPNNSCVDGLADHLASSINNQTFANPSLDVLHAYYWNVSGYYNTTFPDTDPDWWDFANDGNHSMTVSNLGTVVKVLEFNESVQITFQGTTLSEENHPMHIHGNRFYVVGQGFGNYDEEKDSKTYNFVDPVEVNTVLVPRNGWATIRFRSKNPGVWYFHCHFDKHMSWGMAAAFIVKNGGTEETSIVRPPGGMPPCKSSIYAPRHASSHKKE